MQTKAMIGQFKCPAPKTYGYKHVRYYDPIIEQSEVIFQQNTLIEFTDENGKKIGQGKVVGGTLYLEDVQIYLQPKPTVTIGNWTQF